MPWLGLAIVVLAALVVVLLLTRPRTTIVAPPPSAGPNPAVPTNSLANVSGPRAGWSSETRVTTTFRKTIRGTPSDADALLAKMGLPGGLVKQAKESLLRAEEAAPRYPDSTLVFSSVSMSRTDDPNKDRRSESDRLVLACAADPEQVRHWCADWLNGHGWQPDAAAPTTGETAVDGYARGPEKLRIAIVDRALLSLPQGITAPEGQTIYEVRYWAGTQ